MRHLYGCLVGLVLVLSIGWGMGRADEGDAGEPMLAQLAWMAGQWSAETDGVAQEELWLPPAGGTMLGLHRDSDEERQRAFFEYLRVEERGETLRYVAQPGGGAPTVFALESLDGQRVVFANPEHDFPQRITYWLDDDGALNAEAAGEMNGRERSMRWRWERVEDVEEDE